LPDAYELEIVDPQVPAVAPAASGRLFLIALLAFVALGLPDGTLGVAWPSMQATFGLPISRLGVLLIAGTTGYLASSSQSGHWIGRLGVGRLLFWSILLTALASLGFALVPSWPALVVIAVVGGLGAGAIDAGTNAFAAANLSTARINWLHATYGIGAATGPLVMSGVLERALPWQLGYLILAAILTLLAAIFWRSRSLWTTPAPKLSDANAPSTARIRDALRQPVVWINLALFFIYTGLESTAGQWAFSLLTLARNWDTQMAGIAVALYWGSLTGGRVAFGIAARRFHATTILRCGMAIAPLGACLLIAGESELPAFAGLALFGFALAPVFPCLIAETPGRVGSHLSDHAIGLQVSAAYVGIAAVPSLVGMLARTQGLEILGPCLLAGALTLLVLHEAALAYGRTRRDAH